MPSSAQSQSVQSPAFEQKPNLILLNVAPGHLRVGQGVSESDESLEMLAWGCYQEKLFASLWESVKIWFPISQQHRKNIFQPSTASARGFDLCSAWSGTWQKME